MKNLIKLIIICSFVTSPLSSQIKINGYFGYGTYDMSQQKSFHQFFIDNLKNDYGIDLAILDDFPGYFNYAVEIQESFDNTELSFGFIYQSTGARSFYKDYSGQINYDISIEGFGPVIGIEREFYSSELVSIAAKLRPQLLFSNQEFTSNLELYDYGETETVKIKGYNIGIEPSIKLYRQFNRILLSLNAGYYLDLHRGQLKAEVMDEDIDVSIPGTDKALRNNWDGFRVSLGIGYQISSKQSD